MPSLNFDGSINTNTDGQLDMDNNDEYASFAAGMIAATMMIRKDKEFIGPTTAIPLRTVYANPGVYVDATLFVGTAWTPGDMKLVNAFNGNPPYGKYIGRTPLLPDASFSIRWELVNETNEEYTFDECILYHKIGYPQYMQRETHAYRAHVRDVQISLNVEVFGLSEEDEDALKEQYLLWHDTPQQTIIVGNGTTFYTGNQYTLAPGQRLYIYTAHIFLSMTHTLYIDGVLPTTVNAWWFTMRAEITARQEWRGGHNFAPVESRLNNTVTHEQTGLIPRTGVYYMGGDQYYEEWNREHPGTYWTYYPENRAFPPDPPKFETRQNAIVRVSARVSNDTDHEIELIVYIYGNRIVLIVPVGYTGPIETELEIPPKIATEQLSDNTSIEITSPFSIECPEGTVTNVSLEIEDTPIDPPLPSVNYNYHEDLRLSDSVAIVLTGAPNPSHSDNLVLDDDVHVVHTAPPPNPVISEELVLADEVYVQQTVPVIPDRDEHLALTDSVSIVQTVPPTPETNEQLVLNDTVQITTQ